MGLRSPNSPLLYNIKERLPRHSLDPWPFFPGPQFEIQVFGLGYEAFAPGVFAMTASFVDLWDRKMRGGIIDG